MAEFTLNDFVSIKDEPISIDTIIKNRPALIKTYCPKFIYNEVDIKDLIDIDPETTLSELSTKRDDEFEYNYAYILFYNENSINVQMTENSKHASGDYAFTRFIFANKNMDILIGTLLKTFEDTHFQIYKHGYTYNVESVDSFGNSIARYTYEPCTETLNYMELADGSISCEIDSYPTKEGSEVVIKELNSDKAGAGMLYKYDGNDVLKSILEITENYDTISKFVYCDGKLKYIVSYSTSSSITVNEFYY